MNPEFIETFLDLMETASFNRTAERLGITQSTVSNRIATLEGQLGRKLFARSRAGTRATAAGQRFLSHALSLRHEWNEARRSVSDAGIYARALRIGIQADLAANHIGEWVSDIRKALPQASIYVEVDYSNQMGADVLAGELDLAVMFTPRHMTDLNYENVGEIRYVMVSTDAPRIEDVAADRYIRANYSPAFDRAHRHILPALSAAPVASGLNTAICGLLASLGGSAFVLEESADELAGSGAFRKVGGVDPIVQPVYVAVHLRNRHAHVHRRLTAIIKRYFSEQPT